MIVVCCIYHKPHAFGESSDESSSSSSSDEDSSEDDDERARRLTRRRNGRPDEHKHDEDLPNGGEPCAKHLNSRRVRKHQNKKRRPSPNAYERMPKYERKRKEEKAMNGEESRNEMVEDK